MSDQDHNENLRDLAAMFAMNGLIAKYTVTQLANPEFQARIGIEAYELSDALASAKNPQTGIVSVRGRKKND
jgi:hypothetical protein